MQKLGRWVDGFCKNIYGVAFTLLTLTLLLLMFSWKQWPDPIVDFGRELYIPWQILQGKALYQDIAHHKGPLSQYFNALVFWIFKPSILALAMVNAFWALAIAYVYACIFRVLSSATFGVLFAALFLLVFAFNQLLFISNNNFICPYSHEATHGLMLALSTLFAFFCAIRDESSSRYSLSGLLLALLFLTKLEVFLPTAIALALGFILVCFFYPSSLAKTFKNGFFLLCAFTGTLVTAVLLLTLKMPLETAWDGLFAPWSYAFNPAVSNTTFYKDIRGTSDIPGSLSELLKQLFVYMGLCTSFIAVEYYFSKYRRFYLFLSLSSILLMGSLFFTDFFPPLLFRMNFLVLIPAGVAIFATYRIFRDQNSDKLARRILLLCFSIFAQLLLLKIFLRVTTYQYGVFLSSPALLLLAGVTLYWIPKFLTQKGVSTFFFRSMWIAFFAGFTFFHLFGSFWHFDRKTYLLGEASDSFYTDERGPLVNEALTFLKRELPEKGTVLVLPEGGMLNYLLRRESGSRYLIFLPTEFDIFGEDNVLNDIKKASPDYVVLIHRDTSEFGFPFFGTHYGKKIYDWLKLNYKSATLIGSTPLYNDDFGIRILKNKNKKEL